jgi:hypothetical protein
MTEEPVMTLRKARKSIPLVLTLAAAFFVGMFAAQTASACLDCAGLADCPQTCGLGPDEKCAKKCNTGSGQVCKCVKLLNQCKCIAEFD